MEPGEDDVTEEIEPFSSNLFLLLVPTMGLQLFSPSDHFTIFGAKKEHSPSLSHPSPLLVPTVPRPHFLGAEDGMRDMAGARYRGQALALSVNRRAAVFPSSLFPQSLSLEPEATKRCCQKILGRNMG